MNSFYCSKKKVLAIANRIACKKKGYDGESDNVLRYITEQEDTFGYEVFMTKIPDFISRKLHGHSGQFVRSFIAAMRIYKREKPLTPEEKYRVIRAQIRNLLSAPLGLATIVIHDPTYEKLPDAAKQTIRSVNAILRELDRGID